MGRGRRLLLKTIDGPKDSTLNDNADGPYAFADRCHLAAYAATEWLLEYAEDNVDNHGGAWSDWSGASDILTTYTVVLEDDETGERREKYLTAEDITPRGLAVLEAAIAGEDAHALLDAWAEEIWEAS
jgi:hypothetical protein